MHMRLTLAIGVAAGVLLAGCATAPTDVSQSHAGNGIEVVLAHPPFEGFFSCSEHFAGQFESLGDALGTDCSLNELEEIGGRFFSRSYRGLGNENEDWYGWNQPILAACDAWSSSFKPTPSLTSREFWAAHPRPASHCAVTTRHTLSTHTFSNHAWPWVTR